MKKREITDRVTAVGHDARERLMHARMEKHDRENDRLRTEVRLLRDDLEVERGTLSQALKGLEARKDDVRGRRKPRLFRTLLIAGGAYVLGTRDGRERYEQIVRKARSLSAGIAGRLHDRGEGWETSEREGSSVRPLASGASDA
jgi:hypothetical protein